MIQKIEKIEFLERGFDYFPERYVYVYFEGSHNIPDFAVSATQLEKMAFGC